MSVTKTQRKVAAKKLPVKRERKQKLERPPLSGLCSTCSHSHGCGYRLRQSQPVVWCEEFESTSVPFVEETQSGMAQAPTVAEMHEWDKYKGLCVNCENRDSCQIRNKEIGVWHCEEYR
ncbi:MAG: hypothetical protein ABIK39_04925 [candidate division WOR-3 bacterium]